jgi:hypothetical protein
MIFFTSSELVVVSQEWGEIGAVEVKIITEYWYDKSRTVLFQTETENARELSFLNMYKPRTVGRKGIFYSDFWPELTLPFFFF